MDLTPEQERTEEDEGEEDEGEEAEDGVEDSDEEEEDDTAERMEECGEAPATPPEGFVYASCPPLATEEEQRALCGRSILAAHILDGATGWFMGKVQNFGVGPSWKQPDATHIVLYKKAQTEEGARRACGVQAHRRQPRVRGVVAAAGAGRVVKLARPHPV